MPIVCYQGNTNTMVISLHNLANAVQLSKIVERFVQLSKIVEHLRMQFVNLRRVEFCCTGTQSDSSKNTEKSAIRL